jgi:hypothetical protein
MKTKPPRHNFWFLPQMNIINSGNGHCAASECIFNSSGVLLHSHFIADSTDTQYLPIMHLLDTVSSGMVPSFDDSATASTHNLINSYCMVSKNQSTSNCVIRAEIAIASIDSGGKQTINPPKHFWSGMPSVPHHESHSDHEIHSPLHSKFYNLPVGVQLELRWS